MPSEFLAIRQGRGASDEIDAYHRFRASFAAMLDTRFYSIEWLDNEIYSGAARIWSEGDSAIIVTLKCYPSGALELHGLIAVGDLPVILQLIELAEAWGRRKGAIVSCIESRAGWARTMAPHGYQPYQQTLRKDL